MSTPTYDNVRPLVVRSDVKNNTMTVAFQCPVSKSLVESRAAIPTDRTISGNVARSVERNVVWSLRSTVYSAVRSVFGSNTLGRVAQEVTSNALNEMTRDSRVVTAAQKEEAIVAAFQGVARQFRWDPDASRWISAEVGEATQSAFDAQVAAAPLVEPYDRRVLASMLVAVASVDGEVETEEREFLLEFLGGDLPPLETLQSQPPVSPVELSETTAGPARETMMLLAWSLALCDRGMAEMEVSLLDRYAQALLIPPHRNEALKKMAQENLVEGYVATAHSVGQQPHEVRSGARELAAQVGLSPDDAERVAIRYGKRQGWV